MESKSTIGKQHRRGIDTGWYASKKDMSHPKILNCPLLPACIHGFMHGMYILSRKSVQAKSSPQRAKKGRTEAATCIMQKARHVHCNLY